MKEPKMSNRVLLCIMDGWGVAAPSDENATYLAKTPNIDSFQNSPNTTLRADSEFVGLPNGQMGNSEVGHLNLGAGRVVYQELTRINKAISEKTFFENKVFLAAIENVKKNDSALHLMGLVSEGGVHSSMDHLCALIKLAADNGVQKVYVHAFLDGRDTPPQSAITYLEPIEAELKKYNLPQIATVSGRYYAMDRDNRWDRVSKAYNALLFGEGEHANSAVEAVKNSYEKGSNDEFVLPTIMTENSRINDNDSVIFFNFRPDRARELTKSIMAADFDGFERKEVRKNLYFVTMTQYDETFPYPIAFPPEKLTNILGEVLDKHGIKQFRTAETEKYAHITFFFNGGEEVPNKLETRALVKSPSVATYDLKPEMSAYEVCNNVLGALENPEYGFILVNFANPDMVGHTGVLEAAIKACEAVDTCVGKIAQKAKENNVVMLLTADHGNAEHMVDEVTHVKYTAHTVNPVPLFLLNCDNPNVALMSGGALADVAPTILDILNIEKPQEMTGHTLITSKS